MVFGLATLKAIESRMSNFIKPFILPRIQNQTKNTQVTGFCIVGFYYSRVENYEMQAFRLCEP